MEYGMHEFGVRGATAYDLALTEPAHPTPRAQG